MAQEQRYSSFAYILANRGLVALYANDRLPDHTYSDLTNLEVRQENAISMRFGHRPLTASLTGNAPLDGAVLSLGRLVGLTQQWRYGKTAAGSLWRGPGAGFALSPWTVISGGLNPTNRTTFVQVTTPFSANPFVLIADSNLMLKDDGGVFSGLTPWGYPFPAQPVNAVPFFWGGANFGLPFGRGEWFNNAGNYTITGAASYGNTLIYDNPGTITTSANCQVVVSSVLAPTTSIFAGPGNSNNFGPIYVQYVDTTNNIVWCTPTGTTMPAVGASTTLSDYGVEITTVTTIGAAAVITLPAPYFPPWAFNMPTNSGGYAVRFQAKIAAPGVLSSINVYLSMTDASFTNNLSFSIPASSFAANQMTSIVIPIAQMNVTGTPDLGNIVSWRIEIANAGGGSTTVTLAAMQTWFVEPSLPSTFAGIPYDYRVAGWNGHTGSEGPSSQITMPNGSIYHTPDVNQQPVVVNIQDLNGQGFTHYRVYRRGGTLPNTWQMVGQVPINQSPGVFIDTMPDIVAATQNTLAIDNYPPITSTLPQPVNTTLAVPAALPPTPFALSVITPISMAGIALGQLVDIGNGAAAETVVVQNITATSFEAYLQFPHAAGETIYASASYRAAANIACAAFDRVFVAGDPNNPWRLYYSAIGQPESFPPENWIDLPGGTGEIAMGMAFTQGLLFVGTLQGWHKVISVNGSIPIAVKTNARHGLFGVDALEVGEGVIQYLSYDGIYLFNGSTSTEFSQAIQWVFREYVEADGPIPVMDTSSAGRAMVSIGYDKSEIFVSYFGVNDQVRHRAIYSQRDNRWRHDDASTSAQLYEEDTATLIYGDDNGMVYGDRIGDQKIDGYDASGNAIIGPMVVRLATASLDQGQPKNPKVYQEFTIDINTHGQDVQVGLLLDNQQTSVNLGTVNTPYRQQVNFNVNNGLGLMSRNVAFVVTGSLTTNIDIFELHLKALVEAETRESFDTYWTEWGVQEWKLVKQGYFQYTATDVVTVSAYTDGNVTTPTFSVQLPPSATRSIVWKRFPAHMAKSWRFVATCPGNFTMYNNSHIEMKPVCGIKGYSRQPMVT